MTSQPGLTSASSTRTRTPPQLPRSPSLNKITPPKDLSKRDKLAFFDYFFRQLAIFRNTALLYAEIEERYEVAEVTKELTSNVSDDSKPEDGRDQGGLGQGREKRAERGSAAVNAKAGRVQFSAALNVWAQGLARNAWVVCSEGDEEKCPILDPYVDTATKHLLEKLPAKEDITQLVNTILFLHITTAKQYSARTRAFLAWLKEQIRERDVHSSATDSPKPADEKDKESATSPEKQEGDQSTSPPSPFDIDEEAIAWTLKNPDTAIEQAQKQADAVTSQHAERSKILRGIGVSLGAIAGGVLVGVTGGLAAPLVGAGVATILGWLGVGGTVLGLLASGLAGSGVVCAALFGVYGAKSTAAMVERHTREVRDLAIVPVRKGSDSRSSSRSGSMDGLDEKGSAEKVAVRETLGVRLCVSGWLNDRKDVTEPWTVFGGDDTFALQWEIEALEELASALGTLIQAEALKYVKGEIIKRTVFAAIMSSLAPLALLRIGQIIDNPWMNARALGIKAGAVLGELLAERAFGNRPVTLVGYSLGSLVIYEALLELSARAPSETLHLVQDVYIFGAPVPGEPDDWSKIRRVVAGRVVNGYSDRDYVLAVLSRAADATWNVAGLGPVGVKGVENIDCSDVTGHTLWRPMVGKYLSKCGAPGILLDVVGKKQAEAEREQEQP